MNLKANSQMEVLLFKLAKSDSREQHLRPIYDLFEGTKQHPQQPKKILLMPFAR